MPNDVFSISGDISHMMGVTVLIYQLLVKRNATDFSVKTQELFLITYILRYLDVFSIYNTFYTTIAKCFYLITATCIMLSLYVPSRRVYYTINRNADSFPHIKYCLFPAVCLGMVHHHYTRTSVEDFLREISVILEPLSMIPQLHMIYHAHWKVDASVVLYTLLIWLYRTLYIVHYFYKSSIFGSNISEFYLFYACLHSLLVPATLVLHKFYPSTFADSRQINGPTIIPLLINNRN